MYRSAFSTPSVPRSRRAFTLVEVLTATTILGLAIGMVMVVYISVLKRARHTEEMLKQTSELRYAMDFIAQAVRSSSMKPSTTSPSGAASNGLCLYLAPRDRPQFVVQDITWLDTAHTVQGTKSNMRNMKVDLLLPAAANSLFASAARPPSAGIAIGHLADYFVTAAPATNPPKVADYLSTNDVVSIPETTYGNATTATVNSVSQNSGQATITFNAAVGQDVPQGTIIGIAQGETIEFEVKVTSATSPRKTELRYYPDWRDQTKYVVLARNISDQPYTDPTNTTATATRSVPFTVSTSDVRQVFINLQHMPPGTSAGRTLQGVQATVLARSNF